MINSKNLTKIWHQVPPDYYDKGIGKNPLQFIWHNLKYLAFKKLVGKRRFNNVLDVGCGGGTMVNKISQILLESQITAVDVYENAVEYGTKKYPHIKFIVADAHKLPFKNNTFDLVVCYETIEHVINPHKVLAEIKRVMKDNGWAIVSMDSGSLLFRAVWFLWEETFGRVWKGAHIHPFDHTELEMLVNKTGLKIKKKHFSHLGMEVSFILEK